MPGVLIVEALAQAATVARQRASAATRRGGGDRSGSMAGKIGLFAGIDKVRFKRVVKPGDTMRLEAEIIAVHGPVGRAKVKATVDGAAGLPRRADVRHRRRRGHRGRGGEAVIGLRRGLVRGARITALGVHVPERVLTNDEISQFLDTSDEWILTRTGIRERRIARVDQAASDLARGRRHAAASSPSASTPRRSTS